jgi:hypothetical protein
LGYLTEHGPIQLTPSKAFKRVFVNWAADAFVWCVRRISAVGWRCEARQTLQKTLGVADQKSQILG